MQLHLCHLAHQGLVPVGCAGVGWGGMAREVGGHLALCALQLSQTNASLLILGALKVSSAVVLKVAKQQQESVPH